MKFKSIHIFLIIAFFFSVASFAQVDRRVGRGQYRHNTKKEKVDFVEKSVEYLTKELSLDDFQKAAVKNILEEERAAITALNEEKHKRMEELKDKARAISDRIFKKVLPLLSPVQAEKYSKMQEEKKF